MKEGAEKRKLLPAVRITLMFSLWVLNVWMWFLQMFLTYLSWCFLYICFWQMWSRRSSCWSRGRRRKQSRWPICWTRWSHFKRKSSLKLNITSHVPHKSCRVLKIKTNDDLMFYTYISEVKINALTFCNICFFMLETFTKIKPYIMKLKKYYIWIGSEWFL